MSAGHRTAKLSDPEVAEVILGQSPPSSAYNERREGLPFFQGKADFGLLYPVPRIWCDSGQKFAAKGDVLMSVRAPVGDVNKATEDCVIGRGIAALRAGKRTDPWFLLFALEYCKPILESRSTGSTFASVNKATLEDLDIPFPDLPEQQGIGKALAFVVEKIADEGRLLKVSQDLKRAAMRALFTKGLRGEAQKDTEIGPVPESWETPTVAEAVRPFRFNRGKQISASNYYDEGRWPIVDQGRSEIAGYTDDPEKIITPDAPLIIFGDHTRVFKFIDFPFALGADGTKPLLSSEGFDPKFLFHAFTNLDVPSRGYNRHYTVLSEMHLPKPSLAEQHDIVTILDAIDRKIDLNKRKRTVLEELFKFLLHKLMTGEIRVADLDLSALDAVEHKGEAA